jgi:hypothetical protein
VSVLDPYPITVVALVVIVLAVLVTRLLRRDAKRPIARLGVFVERERGDDAQKRSASSPERAYDDEPTWSTDDAPTGVRPLGRDEARARIPRRNRDVEQ